MLKTFSCRKFEAGRFRKAGSLKRLRFPVCEGCVSYVKHTRQTDSSGSADSIFGGLRSNQWPTLRTRPEWNFGFRLTQQRYRQSFTSPDGNCIFHFPEGRSAFSTAALAKGSSRRVVTNDTLVSSMNTRHLKLALCKLPNMSADLPKRIRRCNKAKRPSLCA